MRCRDRQFLIDARNMNERLIIKMFKVKKKKKKKRRLTNNDNDTVHNIRFRKVTAIVIPHWKKNMKCKRLCVTYQL